MLLNAIARVVFTCFLRLQVLHEALEVASTGQSWTIPVDDSGGPTVAFSSTLLGTGSREY